MNNINENQTRLIEIYKKLAETEAEIEQGIPLVNSEEVFEN